MSLSNNSLLDRHLLSMRGGRGLSPTPLVVPPAFSRWAAEGRRRSSLFSFIPDGDHGGFGPRTLARRYCESIEEAFSAHRA